MSCNIKSCVSMYLSTAFSCCTFFVLLLNFVEISGALYPLDISGGLGRRFDGIGGLSAGASSKLLISYPPQQRKEVLDYLFKPNFGANLQILKVEIGGDAQSTDGTEASHMRSPGDGNYWRGYEWWLMKQAKSINPDIKLYGLPWGFPGWVGNYTQNPYTDRRQLAEYIVSWVKGARDIHGLYIDYIGIWNERMYDVNYIKTLRKELDAEDLQNVSIIAADYFGWQIAEDILKDPDLAEAISGIGVHYPGTKTSYNALQTGKPLWSSEDYSTFNNIVGGGCWARILNMNYVTGFMSSTISWSLIASWYNGMPFHGDGLMTANEPWSGHYEISPPVWVTAHTTQFTKAGWNYLKHGSGVRTLENGGSFVTLLSPDQTDLTIVIETMTHDMSVCIRPPLPPYNVRNQTAVFQLLGKLRNFTKLYVWYSKLSLDSAKTGMFVQQAPVFVQNGTVTLFLGVNEIWTLTSLNSGLKGSTNPPPSKPFPLPYMDSFQNMDAPAEPKYLSPQIGSFETVSTNESHWIRQTSVASTVRWCNADEAHKAIAIIGSNNWTDIGISIKFKLDSDNALYTNGIFVATRVNDTGCTTNKAKGIFLTITPADKSYCVTNDVNGQMILAKGKLLNTPVYSQWNSVELIDQGSHITGKVNNITIFNIPAPTSPKQGFAGLGTATLLLADFDNLRIFRPESDFHLKFTVNITL